MSLWIRVDARLVHGQVVASWIPTLGVRHVVVVDAQAAASPLAAAAMELALPPGVSLTVRATPDPTTLLRERTLALVASVQGAEALILALAGAGRRLGRLTLGNVHGDPSRKELTPSLHLSESDMGALERLVAAGVEVEARPLPHDRPVSWQELRRRFEGKR
jgi:mannose/fructose/N-acetylgalactosamine-specific phosphotransferase system component IIB